MTYAQLYDNEWLKPLMRGWKMRCCSCGLVHRFTFKIVKGHVWLKAVRDDRATEACRRKTRTEQALSNGRWVNVLTMPNYDAKKKYKRRFV